jgi:hypothetical protein
MTEEKKSLSRLMTLQGHQKSLSRPFSLTATLEELVEFVENSARPTLLKVPDHGTYIRSSKYEPLVKPYNREVSNVECFAKVIIEEARRTKDKILDDELSFVESSLEAEGLDKALLVVSR